MRPSVAGLLALVVAVGALTFMAGRSRRPPAPRADRLEALTRERDALQEKWGEVVIASGERSLAQAPQADLMIGLPTALTSSILEQVVTGVFGQTTLTLENLRVRKAGEVKARILVRKRTIGEYVLEVKVQRVQGLLKAGAPTLTFGNNRVDVNLPVRLVGGEGAADLHFRWDSKGVAGLVCGDMDITRSITGGVVPADYQLAGSFAIAAVGESIVLSPHFPDLAVRIAVDPSQKAWSVVDEVIRDRPKGCEVALDAIDIKEKLAGLVSGGFKVRIPQKIFKPIRLPAGVRQFLRLPGVDLALQVKPTAVMVAGDRLWYGADISVRRTNR